MQRVIHLVLLPAVLFAVLNGIVYGNTVGCATNFFDKASVTNSDVGFLPELSVGGAVTADRVLSNNLGVNLSARVNVAPGDVGQLAEILFVARYNGGFYMKTSQGWLPWDQQLQSLVAFEEPRVLRATELFDIESRLTLPGDFDVYVGYCLSKGDLQYSREPLTFSLVVLAKPELSVSLLTPAFTTKTLSNTGDQLVLNVSVRNSSYATGSATVLHCYRSTDAVINNKDTEIYRINVPALTGASSIVNECKTGTPNIPGTYYYGACIDRVADEGNTLNNCTVGEPFTVSRMNRAPVASAGNATTSINTTKIITLLGIDTDANPLTYSKVTGPVHGSLSLNGNIATYTPVTDYIGSDSFTFKVNDGKIDSAPATLAITVQVITSQPERVNISKRNDTGITSNQCYSMGGNAPLPLS